MNGVVTETLTEIDRAIEFGKDEKQNTESTKDKTKQAAEDESSVGSSEPATEDAEFEVPAEEDDAALCQAQWASSMATPGVPELQFTSSGDSH